MLRTKLAVRRSVLVALCALAAFAGIACGPTPPEPGPKNPDPKGECQKCLDGCNQFEGNDRAKCRADCMLNSACKNL